MAAPGWVATFDDGPAVDGPEHVFVVGEPWHTIVLAPTGRDPHQPMNPWAGRWAIVGGDGIPGWDEDPPWPGSVIYRLAGTDAVDDDEFVSVHARYLAAT